MKQIPLLRGKALLIEMPEGAHSPVVDDYLLGFNLPAPKWAGDWGDDSYDTIKLPPGNWRIIGMLSEVREEDAAGVVDEPYESGIEQYIEPYDLTGWTVSEAPMGTKYSKAVYKGYRDHTKDPDSYSVREVNPFRTALESLESAIEAAAYTFSNPYGEVEPKYDGYNYNYGFAYESPTEKKRFERDFNDWQAAQSRVLCRERCLLLGREGT